MFVGAAGMREGCEDEVGVGSFDAGDAARAGGVGEGGDDGEDSSFAAGKGAEARGEEQSTEPGRTARFDADPRLVCPSEPAVEGADEQLDRGG